MCISFTCISISSCNNSTYGCCADGHTSKKSLNGENCPKDCKCHLAGSYNQYCDSNTGQCACRPGVIGKLCDTCTIGYWGIKKVLDSQYVGCLPCMCNKFGSIREDCGQETGKCFCKPGVLGNKCTECPADMQLTNNGCVSIYSQQAKNVKNVCSTIVCDYLGSYCSVDHGKPKCVCETINCRNDNIKVCAEDGLTYASYCDLMKWSCFKQTHIKIRYAGQCSQGLTKSPTTTILPRNHLIRDIKQNTSDFNNDITFGYSEPQFAPYGTKICKKDYDCGKNMECLADICYCYDGYYPENNYCLDISELKRKSKDGFGNTQKRYAFDACKSRPCKYNSFCERLDNAKFRCHCPVGKQGKFCSDTRNIIFPSFKKDSFLELSNNIDLKDFNIELEFQSTSLNGLIFFASQFTDGSGDFISLILRNGFIEMRIDGAKDNLEIYTSPNSIELGKFHRLFIKKKENLLVMQLDDNVPYHDQVFHWSFNLKNNVILGKIFNLARISDKTLRKLEMGDSFEGCIQHLIFNQKKFNISFPSNDVLNGESIEECIQNYCLNKRCSGHGRCRMRNDFPNSQIISECVCERAYFGQWCQLTKNACLSSPCQGGTKSYCAPTSAGSFQCVCSEGYGGPLCNKMFGINPQQGFTAEFNGNSFIERAGLKSALKIIDIIFMTNSSHGVILYNHDISNSNDFIGIQLKNGYIAFLVQINGKFNKLISRNPIDNLKTWHHIRILRDKKKFRMFIDSDIVVISNSIFDELNFNISGNLLIGGIKNSLTVNKMFQMTKGLIGAIQRIIINDEIENDVRLHAIELGNINKYIGYPCNHSYCEHDSICMSSLNKFKCVCLPGYSGNFCQYKLNDASNIELQKKIKRKRKASIEHYLKDAIYLDGHSELVYKNRITDITYIQTSNRFEIKFKTIIENCLLFYTGDDDDSFLAIGFVNGKVVYSFSLPDQKQTFELKSAMKLNDNQWHTILIERTKRKSSLIIDGYYKHNEEFDIVNYIGYGQLETDGYIRVGGYRRLPHGFVQSFYYGYQGCIQGLKIDERKIHLIENNLKKIFQPNTC